MKRELGIARCGLACCMCTENEGDAIPANVPTAAAAKTGGVSLKEESHCYACPEKCEKGMLGKIKPRVFGMFAKQYGENTLLDCLERNEVKGVVYHRTGFNGDYDDFTDEVSLMEFIRNGKR